MTCRTCPSRQQLERYLSISLPHSEEADITEHVQECSDCQSVLELLTSEELFVDGRRLIDPAENEAPAAAYPADDWAATRAGNVAGGRPGSSPMHPGRAVLPPSHDYEVLGEVGRGGMGVVFKARQVRLNRLVALKTILNDFASTEARIRFQLEGEMAARIQHPNVVAIFEVGWVAERPFLVMEWVEGHSLARRLSGCPIPPQEAARLLETLARAVHAAHQQGVLHRDLKPANVLLTADGVVKIADFGLAKDLRSSRDVTQTSIAMGTPSYMAPEQTHRSKGDIGPPTDVYALGAIFYELLTGKPPFVGTSPLDTLMLVCTKEASPPARLRPGLPPDLETICLKCLNKLPGQRYPTAEALADDLRRFLDGRPIQARPAGWLERVLKFVRRRPALVAVGGIALAAVLAIVGVVLSYNVSLQDQRDNAREQEKQAKRAQADALQALLELNVSLGLSAEKIRDLPQAALWFAVAAQQAAGDPEREQANRMRWHTYSSGSPVPWRALQLPGLDRPEWLALHPSGKWLLTAAADQWALWDFAAERPAAWPGEAATITAAAWSPDGQTLATGSRAGKVCLYRFPEGQLDGQFEVKGPVSCLTFDAAGRCLALDAGHGCLQVRRVAAGFPVFLEQPHPDRLLAIAFSPKGTRVATFCQNSARAFALDTPADGDPLMLGPVPQLYTIVAIPSKEGPGFLGENRLVTTSGKEVVIWDLAARKKKKLFSGGAYQRGRIDVSAAGGYLVISRHLQEPEMWRADDDRAAVDHTLRSLPADFAAIDPTGQRFLLSLKNGGLQMWNRDRSPASAVLGNHNFSSPLTWSTDGSWFANASKQGLVRLWRTSDPRTERVLLPVPKRQTLPIFFVVSPDSAHVLTVTGQQAVSPLQVHTLADGQPVGQARQLRGEPTGGDFSPDGQTVYVTTVEQGRGWLHAWKWTTGEPVFAPVALSFEPYALACRGDGQVFAIAGGRGDMELRSADGSLLGQAHPDRDRAPAEFLMDLIRFAPDQRTFVTCGREPAVWQWDARNGTLLRRLDHPGWNWCVDAHYSPDSRYLVTASTGGHQAVVWDLRTGQRAAAPLEHPDFVFTARFDPTGERVVTACRDGKTRVWDWRTGQPLLPSLDQSEEVTDAAFSSNGRWIATAEAAGLARLWDARDGSPLAPGWLLQSPGEVPPYFANRLEFTRDSRYLLVGVRGRQLQVRDLARLAPPAELTLSAEDLVALAELNVGATVRPGGHLVSFTSEQWLERWQRFRAQHPEVHPLK